MSVVGDLAVGKWNLADVFEAALDAVVAVPGVVVLVVLPVVVVDFLVVAVFWALAVVVGGVLRQLG